MADAKMGTSNTQIRAGVGFALNFEGIDYSSYVSRLGCRGFGMRAQAMTEGFFYGLRNGVGVQEGKGIVCVMGVFPAVQRERVVRLWRYASLALHVRRVVLRALRWRSAPDHLRRGHCEAACCLSLLE
mmetsp:Transcript_25188/g.50947  ORF Transcript_25188/g.50947 Transcript_25188/m.50947 type:complete len:128 (-) Transcript_25188:400-783(-)|eukprot:CAMPEP_0113820350 /NCGR_PEP_ID=MMETSP0328-20130328/1196_1 /TAXON_ID=39455 /ORGANISM="Alexandrium minutum" /LENGTH=127 /DNA_ID=CAMNT_0000788285 /DNA_START=256 /DNA_END=639 /DNA_ORIENTATION=- /assembly_acc=CAM_ASM_000350